MRKLLKISDTQRIEIKPFKTSNGKAMIRIQPFYKKKDSEDWLPAKGGVSIPEEFSVATRKGLKAASEAIAAGDVEKLAPREGKAKGKKSKDDAEDDDDD